VYFSCSRTVEDSGASISIAAGDLKAVFIDNSSFGASHRAGYNGISELRHTLQDSSIFVPDYAGFNLEHIFGGDSLAQKMEPRHAPMQLTKISAQEVLLHQPATPLSNVESWTTFKLSEPHYIDIRFRCIIHDDAFFKHGYAALFWASYINVPADKKIYFWGRKKGWDGYKRIAAYSPKHGVMSTHVGEDDSLTLYMAPDFNVVLAEGISNYIFRQPFYYGRFHEMVFVYLFNTSAGQFIRFAQSPTGGSGQNPAWDFQFIIPDFQIGKEYAFDARIVYKKFAGHEDIQKEYEQWKNLLK
jgi:hypothetical protein